MTTRLEQVTAELRRVLALAEAPEFIWQDKIQDDAPLWGFNQIRTDYPSDSITRVPNPAGAGFCLRHESDLSFSGAGARAQVGVYGNADVDAATVEGCSFEQECYLPEALSANGDPYSWLSLQDIHVLDADHTNRSYLGLLVEQDGSMKASLRWGGVLYKVNRDFGTKPPVSTIPLPVGRWFKIKTYFKRSLEPTTVRVWLDDELALEWIGAINSLPTNTVTEYYVKLYGGVQRDNPWGKVVRYSRNARIYT